MISAAPARRIGSMNGRGSPNDSMTAFGRYPSANSIVPASTAQLWNPTPQAMGVPSARIGSSRASQARSPPPPPSRPRPPPRQTAATRAAPADPPIGARAMGCRTEKYSVNGVRNVMAAIHPPRGSVVVAGPVRPAEQAAEDVVEALPGVLQGIDPVH